MYILSYSKCFGKVHKQHFVFKAVYAFKHSKCIQKYISTRSKWGMSCQADLKVKAGALRHGGEGRDGCHRGEGTHQHKDTPAMELVG